MTETKIHKDERMMKRADVAAELHRLANELESDGVISYGADGSLAVPDRLEWEIEIERSDYGTAVEFEVEVELKWSTTKAVAGE